MSANLTPEQAAFFDAAMLKWQERLNLKNWRIEKSRKPASGGSLASVSIFMTDRLASYKVGKFDDTSEKHLEATALHELLHVFLAPYRFAIEKELGDDAIMAEEHAIIVFLEKLLMKDAS